MSRKVIQAKVLGHVLLRGRWGGLRELTLPCVESCSTEEMEGWFPGVLGNIMDSPVTQMIKNLPTVQETRVQSLDQEDPLEKEIAIHFNILAWEIPWDREPGGLQSMRLQRVRHDCVTNTFFPLGNIQDSAVVPQGLVFGKQGVQSHTALKSY